jgi:predicted RNA-binding Zn-ribbon protein involved in translation (DUF1610 family)
MPPTPDAWQDYRQRRKRLVWVVLGGLAVFGLSFLPAKTRHSGKPVLAAFVLFAGATLWASVAVSAFPCPHCGKPFTHDDDTRDEFTRECVHCHSPKWSNPA